MPAFSDPLAPQVLLDAVATTGAGTAVDYRNCDRITVVTSSATTSSCTVKIETSVDGTNFAAAATITDPAASPNATLTVITGPCIARANVTARVSGTITVKALGSKTFGKSGN